MYYTLYAFLTIIIIIINIIIIIFITIIIIVVVVIFQLRKAAIIKRALIGLSYVARARGAGRARSAREGVRGSLFSFSLRVRPRHFFFRSHKKAMIATIYDEGTTLEPLCARQISERTWRGGTRGAGAGGGGG